MPQSVRLPLAIVEDPDFKDGVNYYGDQSDNFFVGNSFPTCGINFDAREIMNQTEKEPVKSSAKFRRCGPMPRRRPFGETPMDGSPRAAAPHGGRVEIATAACARSTSADLTIFAGRVHAILGENGAGQIDADQGASRASSRPIAAASRSRTSEVAFPTPAAAQAAGIAGIFQELSLVPELSVADNILINKPPKRLGLIDRRRAE